MCRYNMISINIKSVFPSPGGDVLCQGVTRQVILANLFPSPGGDVLCPMYLSCLTVSPLMGCRPLAGMCCVAVTAVIKRFNIDELPSPGGVVLCLIVSINKKR